MTRSLTRRITLVRIQAEPGVWTYAAVHADEAVNLLAGWLSNGTGDSDTVSWDLLPGVAPFAAAELARGGELHVVLIGTAQGNEWVSWHPPLPAPPIPAPALHRQAS